MNLSVIGLGKLGAPMAAVFAHKGHNVIGLDVNPGFVQAINAGTAPVIEPGLDTMIAANRTRLSATMDYAEAVAKTDVTFIIVPTPSKADGMFSVDLVLSAGEMIGRALRYKTTYHIVVLSATVMPGATEKQLLPVLERASGKKCGVDFGLCYNPEFIALGSVIRDMLNPDMILIGESDERAGGILADLYRGVCDSHPVINRMNFVNAELAKISVNTFVTTKISYANMLAQLCETLPGADVNIVTTAIGCDSRIGKKYLKGALGYGGPCFPRDNVAFAALARKNGAVAMIAEATDAINRLQASRLATMITALLPKNGVAGILGLSYKPDTNVIEESQGIAVAAELLAKGLEVVVYDPAAMDNARRLLIGKIRFARSLDECARAADVLAITTPWTEFQKLAPEDLKNANPRPVLIDCWRLLSPETFQRRAEYVALGLGVRASEPQPEEVGILVQAENG